MSVFGEKMPVETTESKAQKFNERGRRELTAEDIRFTRKGNELYVFVMGWPSDRLKVRSLGTESALRVKRVADINLVGSDQKIV